jgi:hypothetical protein
MSLECRQRLVAMVVHIIVSADEGSDHGTLVCKRLLESPTCTESAIGQRHPDVGHILSADTSKKLIHVVYYA